MMSTKNNQFAVNDIVLCLCCFSLKYGLNMSQYSLKDEFKPRLRYRLTNETHIKCRQDFSTFFIIHMLSQIARIKDINVVCSSIKDLLSLLHNHVYFVSLRFGRWVYQHFTCGKLHITGGIVFLRLE